MQTLALSIQYVGYNAHVANGLILQYNVNNHIATG